MKYNFSIFLLFISSLLIAQTNSQQISPPLTKADPNIVGMSPQRLDRVDRMCKEAIETGQVPGIVALIARKGKIVFYESYGTANASGKNLEKDAIFRIASQTKAITSTAVMMLWEEGKFRLEDPISKYIPEFKNPQVLDSLDENTMTYTTIPATREITIRDLITHTSGLGYGVIDGDPRIRKIYEKAGITDLFTTENISIGESVKKLAKLPLHHNPGEAFTYSEGLDVLGYFIEIVSGVQLDEFFQTRIFNPLKMKDTGFYLPQAKANRLVAVQTKTGDKWENYPVTFYDTDYPIKGAKRFFSGGAGLSSTAEDYATFLQMYLNQGELNGMRLLSRTTVQFMMSNQIGELWGNTGQYYGLAFGVLDQKGQDLGGKGSKGTFDWGGYFNTQYFADPEEDVIGILMKQTQNISRDDTAWKFRQLVFQAIDN